MAAILPGPEELLSVERGGDHRAGILGEDECTCTNWEMGNLSLVVLRVGARGVDRVRWVECWVLEREGEARLDNYRVVRVGREAWWAVGCEGWLTCCLDGDDVNPMRCRL